MNEVLVPTVIFGGLYATIVLISYYRNRKAERLALIASGKDGSIFNEQPKSPVINTSLKYGLLMIGVAIGLLMGDFLAKSTTLSPAVAYTSMALIFGGASLLVYYYYQKKAIKNN